MLIRRLKHACLLTLVLTAPVASAWAKQNPHDRDADAALEQFVLALAAYREDDWQNADAHYQRLLNLDSAFPLAGYLEYHRLRQQLPHVSEADMLAFIRRHEHSPLASDARELAIDAWGRSQQWQKLRAVSQGVPGNMRLRCFYYQALLSEERQRGLEAARQLYLSGQSRPAACDPLFDALADAGTLDDTLVWLRIQLAYDAGSAGLMRYLRSTLSTPALQKRADQLLNLYQRPQDIRLVNAGELDNSLIIKTLERLAKKNPDYAYQLLPVMARRFGLPDSERVQVTRQIAWYLVIRDEHADAPWLDPWLRQHGDEKLLDQRIRAAIRTMDWPAVADFIAALPQDSASSPRWQYWLGRSLAEQQQHAQAEERFREAADERSFWGFLAAEKLGQPPALNNAGAAHGDTPLSEENQLLLAQVRLLQAADEAGLARQAWLHALRRSDSSQLPALAEAAADNGWPHLAIESALYSGHRNVLDWRFPLDLADDFKAAGNHYGVDPLLLMSVARRESAFNAHARSPAGARGLMQLMPATARAVARKASTPEPRASELNDPALNLSLGSQYLAGLLDRYQGNRILALAAYNAGPHRVDRWLSDEQYPFDVFIEAIPFYETREYVQAILAYRVIFAERAGVEVALMKPQETIGPYHALMLASSQSGTCSTC